MKTGIELIAAERTRQIEVEGFTPEKDQGQYFDDDLSTAAACYAVYTDDDQTNRVIQEQGRIEIWGESTLLCGRDAFPWEKLDKRDQHDRLRRLVIAGALIAAEIDLYLARHPEEVQ